MSSPHDFDFLHGRWCIRNERLRERLTGCTDWDSFEATGECKPLPGALGNLDDFVTDHWPGFVGMSLRLFGRIEQRWSIYWVSNRDGVLGPPVVGQFVDGVGRFEGRDQHEGTPVLVRFAWSDITPSSARWQQAFSADQGTTWETNWVMSFTRAA